MLVLPAAYDLVWRGLEGCVERDEDGAVLRVRDVLEVVHAVCRVLVKDTVRK